MTDGMRRRERGSALIETAIIMPLYMIILLGVIYFGYATISRQREGMAAAYAAWLPGTQDADELLKEYWPWEGEDASLDSRPSASGSTATMGDMRLSAQETPTFDDLYYRNEIASRLETPIVGTDGAGHTFDRERVAEALWEYALGHLSQSVDLVRGVQTHQYRNDMGRYLSAQSGTSMGGGFVNDANTVADLYSDPMVGKILSGFDGRNGYGSGNWIVRTRVDLAEKYRPAFFPQVVADRDAPPSDFSAYVTGNYPEPALDPSPAIAFDLTTQNEESYRYAAREGGYTSRHVIDKALSVLGVSAAADLDPHGRDAAPLGSAGALSTNFGRR